jgi:F0F1-type ATP synthase assembly protein I
VTGRVITASVTPAMRDTGEPAQAAADVERRAQSAGLNQAMRVLSYLIAGVGFYGFLGWVGDRFFGTGFLLPVGIVLGAGLAVYMIIRYVTTTMVPAEAAENAKRPVGRTEGAR